MPKPFPELTALFPELRTEGKDEVVIVIEGDKLPVLKLLQKTSAANEKQRNPRVELNLEVKRREASSTKHLAHLHTPS